MYFNGHKIKQRWLFFQLQILCQFLKYKINHTRKVDQMYSKHSYVIFQFLFYYEVNSE